MSHDTCGSVCGEPRGKSRSTQRIGQLASIFHASVVARLERLAARDATSVGAVAVRELAEVSRRADNPALLGSLPDFGVNAATILHDLDAGRADR